MKKWLGRIMLSAIFVGWAATPVILAGWKTAALVVGISIFLAAWIIIAVWLLDS